MKQARIRQAGGAFEIVEAPMPRPGAREVRVKVAACGICHSDDFVRTGHFPGLTYPRSPGHEIAGVVDAVGADVTAWKPGDRVGVGWHGGHCFHCDPCRGGDFINCGSEKITGISYDGGYGEYMVAPQEAVARLPDGLTFVEAAPLLCAGITTFNALRHSGARPGDLVAVQGIGGLGHLGVQFAAKMGFHTVAISGGADKRALALKLGAHDYIDGRAAEGGAGAELARRGGARVILATVPSSKAMAEVAGGLGPNGTLLIVGASMEALGIPPVMLLAGRKRIQGWASGTAKDSEETLKFAALTGVRPMTETYPIDRVGAAFERMMSNEARFRVVLTHG